MKSISRIFLLLLAVSLAVSACENKVSPVTAYTASDPYLVMDFERTSSWLSAVNAALYDPSKPVTETMLGLTFWPSYTSTGTVTRSTSAAVGTGCARKSGYVTGNYSRFAMFLNLRSATRYFDMSPFSGVKFYYRMPAMADPSLTNTFRIGVRQTVPIIIDTSPSSTGLGGECLCRGDDCSKPNIWDWDWKCYRHQVVLAYTDNWTPANYSWSDFTRGTDGYAVTPSTLTGQHLKELVQMEWMSEHLGADSASFDLYIDEVRFF